MSVLQLVHITETIKDLYLFARNLTFKFIYDKGRQNTNLERELTERTKDFTMDEFCSLHDLMLLYDEGFTDDPLTPLPVDLSGVTDGPTPAAILTMPLKINKPKKFKPKSWKFPDLMTCPAIWAFLQHSIKDLKRNHWQDLPPNLTRNQQLALKQLQKSSDIIIKPSDKGGNIVIMTHVQ